MTSGPVRSLLFLVGGMLFAWSLVAVSPTTTPPGPPPTTTAPPPPSAVVGAAALDEACRRQQGERSSAVYYAAKWRCVAPEGEIWDADDLSAEHACGARHADGASLVADDTGVHCRQGR